MISGLQDPVLEVLSYIFHCWVLDLVCCGHRQGWMPAVVRKKGVSPRDRFTEVSKAN
jgi:hypothetical protein